jgi:small subunit ribosomal protein S13
LARIAGVDLPREKRIEVGLTYIYGIGPTSAQRILGVTRVDPNKRVKNLSEEETARLRQVIESDYKVEGALRSEMAMNIKRLMDIGCYRGMRHRRGLPVRGQRTRTNARTRKGPLKSSGILKRKIEKKKGPPPTRPATA